MRVQTLLDHKSFVYTDCHLHLRNRRTGIVARIEPRKSKKVDCSALEYPGAF